jgi:hypothetical protein
MQAANSLGNSPWQLPTPPKLKDVGIEGRHNHSLKRQVIEPRHALERLLSTDQGGFIR